MLKTSKRFVVLGLTALSLLVLPTVSASDLAVTSSREGNRMNVSVQAAAPAQQDSQATVYLKDANGNVVNSLTYTLKQGQSNFTAWFDMSYLGTGNYTVTAEVQGQSQTAVTQTQAATSQVVDTTSPVTQASSQVTAATTQAQTSSAATTSASSQTTVAITTAASTTTAASSSQSSTQTSTSTSASQSDSGLGKLIFGFLGFLAVGIVAGLIYLFLKPNKGRHG